nr:isopentenyl-diphosphate delta-isomerase i [Quercus suber]
MFSNSMRTSATTTAAAARLSFPILIQQQPTSFVNYRHHLFSSSSAFALRLPKVSRLTARVFSSFQVAMGVAPDAGMDAVQRRLMFEDE